MACHSKPLAKNGASEEVRTLDIHLGKVVLYQLSYARLLKIGKPVWNAGHVNIVFAEFAKEFQSCKTCSPTGTSWYRASMISPMR